MGAIVALNLEDGGLAETTVVLRSNYQAVKENGFSIKSVDHGNRISWRPTGGILPKVPIVLEESLKPFDYILCCTKNTPDIPPLLADLIQPAVTTGHSVIVLVQNGLYIEKPILAAFPKNVCLSGVSFCGAVESSPGVVVHNDSDRLDIGLFPGNYEKSEAAQAGQKLVEMCLASGKIQSFYDKDVMHTRWRKLLINAVYNPISALTNLDTSRLRLSSLEDSNRADIIGCLLKPAMREVIMAAKAVDNVTLGGDLIKLTIESDPVEAFIMPSMQQDVRKGRFIEYENILGEALRAAQGVGLEVPIMQTLYFLCKAVQFRTKEEYGMVDVPVLLKKYTARERL